MAFERPSLFREIELHIEGSGQILLDFLTDMPGHALAARLSAYAVNSSSTLPRSVYRVRLPGTTLGKLFKLKLYGTGNARLYAWGVQYKQIGLPEPTGWQWFRRQLQTVEWTSVKLPIPDTSDAWTKLPIPMRPSTKVPEWIDLPVDSIE